MSKELEALQKLRDLVEYLTRIDYVPTDLRNQVKELLIKSYKDSNGYFSQIEEALKRLEKFDKWAEKLKEDDNCAIQCAYKEEKLELNELYDPQPFKTLDGWDYWSDEK